MPLGGDPRIHPWVHFWGICLIPPGCPSFPGWGRASRVPVPVPTSPEPLLAGRVPQLQLGPAGRRQRDGAAVEIHTDSGAGHGPPRPLGVAAQQRRLPHGCVPQHDDTELVVASCVGDMGGQGGTQSHPHAGSWAGGKGIHGAGWIPAPGALLCWWDWGQVSTLVPTPQCCPWGLGQSRCPVLTPTPGQTKQRRRRRERLPRCEQPQGHSPGGVWLFAPCSRPCHLLSLSPATEHREQPRGGGGCRQELGQCPRKRTRGWRLSCTPSTPPPPARVTPRPLPAPGHCCPPPTGGS